MNFSSFQINSLIETVKSTVFHYSPIEALLVKLTNNDPWGHDTKDLQQLVKMCDGNTGYQQNPTNGFNGGGHSSSLAFALSFLHEKCANTQMTSWRGIYKSLSLLDYLLKHGSERNLQTVIGIVQQLSHLSTYQFVDQGKDTGINVRHKLKTMTEMINNNSVLLGEREKAHAQVQKFHGGDTRGFNAKGGLSSEDYYKSNLQKQQEQSSSPTFNIQSSPAPKSNPFKQQAQQQNEDDEFGDFEGGNDNFKQINQDSRDNSNDLLDEDTEFGDFESHSDANKPISNAPIQLFDEKPKGVKLDFDNVQAVPISFIAAPNNSLKPNSSADLFGSPAKQQKPSVVDLLGSPTKQTNDTLNASPKKQQLTPALDLFSAVPGSQPSHKTNAVDDLFNEQLHTKTNTITGSTQLASKPINTSGDPFASLVDFSSVKRI